MDFNNIGIKATYENFFWMTLITMTTVGYGDFAPRTVLGRLTACLCASWGVLIMSIMVVVLTETFYLQKSILNDYLG